MIDTGQLLINNGVVAGSATLGAGNAGDMIIRARVFDLVGSGINCGTLVGSTGSGGNITFAGERFIVRDGSAIVTITRTEAPAGNINIKASESVEVLRTSGGDNGAETLLNQAFRLVPYPKKFSLLTGLLTMDRQTREPKIALIRLPCPQIGSKSAYILKGVQKLKPLIFMTFGSVVTP